MSVNRVGIEDWWKKKAERWRRFNRYIKEFHTRREKLHREKLDKLQREKIALLKNNDVEGYLRMVQVSNISVVLCICHRFVSLSGSRGLKGKSNSHLFHRTKSQIEWSSS